MAGPVREFANRGLLILAVLTGLACGSTGGADSHAARSAAPPSTAQLIEWAYGSDNRGSYPPTADAYLTILSEEPPQKAEAPEGGTRLTPQCADITSILPGPLGELFMLLGGALHVLRPSKTGPLPLSGDASVRLTRLLGIHTDGPSIQILAAAQPEGSGEEQVWSLTISGSTKGTFHAEPLANERKPRSVEEFFATYQSPRCQAGGKQCLLLSNDGREDFIDVAPTRGAGVKTLRRLGNTGLRDVAWKPGGGIYAVMSCPPKSAP